MQKRLLLKVAALLFTFIGHQAIATPLDDATAAFEARRYAEAKSLLEPLAASGATAAKRMLGEMYYAGNGVPQNKAMAVKWTSSAAADEDRLAQFSMGYLHENGDGVEKSNKKAIAFYRKSALQRYVPAMVKLADLLEYSDPQSAKYWYKTASEYGDADARSKFARLGAADAAAANAQIQKWEAQRKEACASSCPVNAERTRCELKMMEPEMCSDNAAPPIEVQVNVAGNNGNSGGLDPRVFRGVPNINPGHAGLPRNSASALAVAGGLSQQPAPATTTRQGAAKSVERISPTLQSQSPGATVPTQSATASPPSSTSASAPSQREPSASTRYTCNLHEVFRTFSSGKLTKEQACESANAKASAFANALGNGTVATQLLGGQDTRKLQSVESCRISDGDAVVRVNYSEVQMNPCGSSGQGIAR